MEHEQKSMPTREFDSDQVEIQKEESKLVQKWSPNQRIDVHTLSPSMKCDHKIGDSISQYTRIEFNVDSGIEKKIW